MTAMNKTPPEPNAPETQNEKGESPTQENTRQQKLAAAQFRFDASMQSTAKEMIEIINDDRFTDDVKDAFKERLLIVMLNLTETKDPAQRVEVKTLMEHINHGITFTTPEQEKEKERILTLLPIA
jgi:hypothetical protein